MVTRFAKKGAFLCAFVDISALQKYNIKICKINYGGAICRRGGLQYGQ